MKDFKPGDKVVSIQRNARVDMEVELRQEIGRLRSLLAEELMKSYTLVHADRPHESETWTKCRGCCKKSRCEERLFIHDFGCALAGPDMSEPT